MTDCQSNDASGREENLSSADVREVRAWAHLQMTTVDAAVAPVTLRPPKWPDNQGD